MKQSSSWQGTETPGCIGSVKIRSEPITSKRLPSGLNEAECWKYEPYNSSVSKLSKSIR